MKSSAKALSLFLGLVLSSAVASAKEPTFTLRCGFAQGTETEDGNGTYRPIAEKVIPLVLAGNAAKETVELTVNTPSGDPIKLHAFTGVNVIGNYESSAIFLTIELPNEGKAFTVSRSTVTSEHSTTGDILENGMSIAVGKNKPDFFKAGCVLNLSK